jgi:hypothetical protein
MVNTEFIPKKYCFQTDTEMHQDARDCQKTTEFEVKKAAVSKSDSMTACNDGDLKR